MSQSLLRGLRALEILGTEPLGVSEIARRLSVDKAGVSRTLAALAREDWLERTGSRYVLGPRALKLGLGGSTVEIARAQSTVRHLGESLGLTVVALCLAGSLAQPLAHWTSNGWSAEDTAPEAFDHLAMTAGGIALLGQLPPKQAEALLADLPQSAPSPRTVRELIAGVRDGEPAVERSWTVPGLGCVAVPWPVTPGTPVAALAVLGPVEVIDRKLARIVKALRAAA